MQMTVNTRTLENHPKRAALQFVGALYVCATRLNSQDE
jgi:hypothetical protein